jgi:hypothetical protein
MNGNAQVMIKGIECRNNISLPSRNGISSQGEIYLHGQKIGWYEDEGRGGCWDIHFESPALGQAFNKIVKEYYGEEYNDMLEPEDQFLAELLDLMDFKKQYDQITANGYPIVVHMQLSEHPMDTKVVGLKKGYLIEPTIERYKPLQYRVYKSPTDFIIE